MKRVQVVICDPMRSAQVPVFECDTFAEARSYISSDAAASGRDQSDYAIQGAF